MPDTQLAFPGFVGRALELSKLNVASERIADDRHCTVLLTAEAGFGKTRLLTEWLDRLTTPVTYLRFDCQPEELRPYPLLHALGDQLDSHRATLSEATAAAIEAIRRCSSPATRNQSSGPLAEQAVDALLQISASDRLALVLEDLHWADTFTVEFVERLTSRLAASERETGRCALLLLATYRPFEGSASFLTSMDKRARPDSMIRLDLRGFDDLETDALVVEMGLPRLTTRANRMLRDATAGNPFHLQICVRSLLDQSRLAVGERSTDIIGHGIEAELSQDLVGALTDRLSAASDGCLDLLARASLLTQPFSFARLATAADAPPAALAALLAEARTEGLLIGNHESYVFAHPLLRVVLNRRLGPEQVAMTHGRLADQLLANQPSPIDRLEAGRHLLRAGPWASDDSVIEVALDASELAYRLGEYAEAAEMAEAGLTALERHDSSPDFDTAAKLHLRAGAAFHRAHEQDRYGPHLDEAIELAVAANDLATWAEALEHRIRGDQTIRGLRVDENELDALLAALGPHDSPLRSRTLQLRSEIGFAAGSYSAGRDDAVTARQIAQRLGANDLEANAAVAQGLSEWAQLDLSNARASLETAHRLSMLQGERWASTWAQARLSMVHLLAGRLDQALQHARECAERAAANGQWSDRALARAIEASALLHQGELALAERAAQRCLAEVERGEYERAAAIAAPVLACARALRGDRNGAQDALDRFAFGRQPAPRLLRILSWITSGDLGTGRALIDPTRQPPAAITALNLFTACGQAEALMNLSLPVGEAIVSALQAAEATGAILVPEWQCSVPRLWGAALRSVGDPDASLQVLDSSLARLSLAGALPEVAFVHLELARSLGQAGASPRGDALWHAEAAMEVFEQLEFARPLEIARREALSLGSHRAARSFPNDDSVVGPPIQGVFLMSDIVSSTSQSVRYKDETWVRIMNEHDRRVAACLTQFGGVEFAHRGDGIAAYFPASGDGLRCAMALHRSLAAVDTPDGTGLLVRIGLSRDEARPRRVTDLCGLAIARVARIMSVAGDGGTVIGAEMAAEAAAAGLVVFAPEHIAPKGFETNPFSVHYVSEPGEH